MTPIKTAAPWLFGDPAPNALLARLLRPIDGAWLAALRVLLGVSLAVSMWRFTGADWIHRYFVEPRFFFKYWGFEWVGVLSARGMQVLIWSLFALALCMAAGLLFRLSALLFTLGLVYLQLIDVATYLNHYYLAALLALLLALSPAGRVWSIDAWLAQRLGRAQATNVSAVWLYLLRFQIGLVYVFAGLAKLQSDWLLHAQPLRIWLGASTDLPVLGPLFTLPWVPLAMSWGGFLFDTFIVAFLLHPRTRLSAYGVLVVFHVLTRVLLPIGMFPVIMTVSALVFLSPDWPRRWLGRLGRALPASAAATSATLAPRALQRFGLALAAGYCALQLVLPLRYLAYGGNVLWHEQGMRFGWRVMVRAKGGGTTFVVHSARLNHTWHVNPRDYLTRMQEAEMSSQPDLIVQLAQHIRRDFEQRGLGPVEVRADSRVALNGRRSARLLDPRVDLGRVEDGLAKAPFVLPAPPEAPAHTRPVL
ncbi:MAG TPA: HTTM domain-containing protein [Polyangiaceae bacterium]|nr:HTTM domain-containing protein [Polyangiaceae bacterium]